MVHHELLRGIGLCAGLLELRLFRPAHGLGTAGAGPARPRSGAHLGAQSAYGAGLILARWWRRSLALRPPALSALIVRPASPLTAAVLFLAAPSGNGFGYAAAGHFLVGFGPMLWLICQITVRQLVTPAPLMGRVNATMQTAIYGVRPLGALAGGFVAAHAGLHGALLLIAAAFALSTLVIVLSPLAHLRVLPEPAPSGVLPA